MFDVGQAMRVVQAGTDATLASTEERSTFLLEVERLEAQIAAHKAKAIAVWDAHLDWSLDGAVSGPMWLAHRGEASKADARAQVRVARRLTHMPATTAALEAGTIGWPKAKLLADARRDDVRGAFDQAEAMLVREAARLTVDQLADVLRAWRNRVLDDQGTADADAQRAACELFISPTVGGMHVINGTLDAEWGAMVRTAIDAIADDLYRSDRADTETPMLSAPQRRAHALAELTRRASSTDPDAEPARPSLLAVVEQPGDGSPLGGGEIDDTGPIGAATAQRLACTATITAVTIDGRGNVLDVDPTRRAASPAQRKALRVRDRGCTFPGCDRPPRWCEAHHITHHRHGGPTTMDNLTLLCSRHHHLIHEGGFRAWRDPDAHLRFARPDGTDITRSRPNQPPPAWRVLTPVAPRRSP